MGRKISKEDDIVIKITDGCVHIKIVDNMEYPIDIWNFDRKKLSQRERVFVDNFISMAMTMANDQEKSKSE